LSSCQIEIFQKKKLFQGNYFNFLYSSIQINYLKEKIDNESKNFFLNNETQVSQRVYQKSIAYFILS
jgi:hypothetical protein